ncbi:MAG: hypothetical protein K0S74_1213 [Chlamydiales bacterium]|jgi:hypothetical protein|nr:hypothetical protein [Chlamydiales bacterium]
MMNKYCCKGYEGTNFALTAVAATNEYRSFELDSTELDSALDLKDKESIIKKSNLFQLCFLKTFAEHQLKLSDRAYSVNLTSHLITISGTGHVIADVAKILESLRVFLAIHFDTKEDIKIAADD